MHQTFKCDISNAMNMKKGVELKDKEGALQKSGGKFQMKAGSQKYVYMS